MIKIINIMVAVFLIFSLTSCSSDEREIDKEIERVYAQFKKKINSEPYFICWSDHGHIPTKKRINLYDVSKKLKINLDKIFHIIDSTTVRFWVENNNEGVNILVQGDVKNMNSFIQSIQAEAPEASHISAVKIIDTRSSGSPNPFLVVDVSI